MTRRHAGAMLLAFMVGFTGCDSSAKEKESSPELTPERSGTDFAKVVGELRQLALDRSTARQVRLGPNADGVAVTKRDPVPRALPPDNADIPRFFEPPPAPIGTFWEPALTAAPKSMAVANDGSVFVATEDQVLRYRGNRAAETWRDVGAEWLQVDAEGKRLLVQHGETLELAQIEGTGSEMIPAEARPAGRAYWIGDGKKLLFVREDFKYSANERDRIFLDARVYEIATKKVTSPGWEVTGHYAALGTLPAMNTFWGLEARPYQINPLPAPVVLVANGKVAAKLTQTEIAADRQPSAGKDGSLFWVRTWRANDEAGRVLFRPIAETPYAEHQLTALPATTVSISPDGSSGGYVIQGGGDRFELYHFTHQDLDTSTDRQAAFMSLDAAKREAANVFFGDLEIAFSKTPLAAKVIHTELGASLAIVPDPGSIAVMARALRNSMKSRFQVDLAPGVGGLKQMDAFLADAALYLKEEPSTIIALAGFLAESFPAKVEWDLTSATQELSPDTTELSYSDGLTWTAVAPFGIARECLAGDARLADEATRIASTQDAPYYFVENFGITTQGNLKQREIQRSGVKTEGVSLSYLRDFLAKSESNDTVTILAVNNAKLAKIGDFQVDAATRLVSENPTVAAAWFELGSALNEVGEPERGFDCFMMATELAPEECDYWFSAADTAAVLDKLSQAESLLDSAAKTDTTGRLQGDIADRRELIKSLRNETAK